MAAQPPYVLAANAGRRRGRALNRALILAFVLALAACRPAAPAGRYQKDGLAFDHLAGWAVVSDTQKKARTVTVEGPDNSLLTVSIFDLDAEVSLERFVEIATRVRAANVKKTLTVAGVNLGSEAPAEAPAPVDLSIAGQTTKGLAEHFSLNVINVAVPHTVEFAAVTLADRPVIIMKQSPDKSRAGATPGFQKILDTLALTR